MSGARKAASVSGAAFFVCAKIPTRKISHRRRRILFGTESVSDGRAHAKHIVGVKLNVIHDVVKVSLRADKETSKEGIAYAGAKVEEKVVAV